MDVMRTSCCLSPAFTTISEVFGGISPRLEGEEMKVNNPGFSGGDRTSILLPAVQTQFLKFRFFLVERRGLKRHTIPSKFNFANSR